MKGRDAAAAQSTAKGDIRAETDRQTDRHRDRDRQTGRQTEGGGENDRIKTTLPQNNGEQRENITLNWKNDFFADLHGKTETETDRQTDRQTDR